MSHAGPNLTVEERRARKAASDRRYRLEHVDELRTYHHARYLANREQRATQDRERRLRDPEAARERARRWRQAHPERARGHRRDWLQDAPDRAKAVRAAITANRRARMYGADGQIGYETVLDLWRRQPWCVGCGEGYGLDHIVALSRGGSNTSGNLQNLCPPCNNRKGTKTVVAA